MARRSSVSAACFLLSRLHGNDTGSAGARRSPWGRVRLQCPSRRLNLPIPCTGFPSATRNISFLRTGTAIRTGTVSVYGRRSTVCHGSSSLRGIPRDSNRRASPSSRVSSPTWRIFAMPAPYTSALSAAPTFATSEAGEVEGSKSAGMVLKRSSLPISAPLRS